MAWGAWKIGVCSAVRKRKENREKGKEIWEGKKEGKRGKRGKEKERKQRRKKMEKKGEEVGKRRKKTCELHLRCVAWACPSDCAAGPLVADELVRKLLRRDISSIQPAIHQLCEL